MNLLSIVPNKSRYLFYDPQLKAYCHTSSTGAWMLSNKIPDQFKRDNPSIGYHNLEEAKEGLQRFKERYRSAKIIRVCFDGVQLIKEEVE